MDRNLAVVLALASALVVSGCASSSDGDVQETRVSDLAAPSAQSDAARGGIEGIVTDDSLTGISGALVSLVGPSPHQTTTDPLGRFAFSLVPPGDYEASFKTDGFQEYRTRVTVAANAVAEIHVQLHRLPSLDDYSVTSIADGYLGCSVAIYIQPIDRWQPANVCGIPGLEDEYLVSVPMAGSDVPELSTLLFETAWQPTQLLGSGLNIRISVESDAGEDVYGSPFWDVRGHSPLRFELNRTLILEMGAGSPSFFEACEPNGTCHGELAAYPWPDTLGSSSPVDLGANIEQRFTHYVTEFYRFAAPTDFTAIPDA